MYNYERLINEVIEHEVIEQLGEETDKNIFPLVEVLNKIYSRLVNANFQYATFLILNNDLSKLVEPDQYHILNKYNNHDQDYIKTAFCVCLNKQISQTNNSIKNKL